MSVDASAAAHARLWCLVVAVACLGGLSSVSALALQAEAGQLPQLPFPVWWPAWRKPLHGVEYHRILLPSSKLAVCYIPKVACEQITNLFSDANGVSFKFWSSTPPAMNISWSSVTKQSGWKFGIFTRDPLERYLSCWLSKCTANAEGVVENQGTNCRGRVLQEPTSLEGQIRAFEERALLDRVQGHPYPDTHWASQVNNVEGCGWDRFGPEHADFNINLAGDVHTQVLTMLQTANVPRNAFLTDKYFPAGRIAGHTSNASNMIRNFYRNPEVLRTVLSFFADDYAKLHLPVPLWAVEALK